MLILNMGRALNRAGRIDVADDRIRLIMVIPQLEQRRRHSLIHNLDHPSADEFFVLHKRQVRFDTCGVAVHHEAYRAGGG